MVYISLAELLPNAYRYEKETPFIVTAALVCSRFPSFSRLLSRARALSLRYRHCSAGVIRFSHSFLLYDRHAAALTISSLMSDRWLNSNLLADD